MIEIHWLKEHGLVASYEDYLRLPFAVLEDARLRMEADALKVEQDAKRRRAR